MKRKEITCHKCKSTYSIDYDMFYKKMIERNHSKKDIICPACNSLLITLRNEKVNIPITSKIVEEEIKPLVSQVKICSKCNEELGLPKGIENTNVPQGKTIEFKCNNCGKKILKLIGSHIEKSNGLKVKKIDLGYSGVKKYSKPRRRVELQETPLLYE